MNTRIGLIISTSIMILLGVRAQWLFVRYILWSPVVFRYHVETAFVIFVVAGIALVLFRRTRGDETTAPAAVPLWMWPTFCAAALALYLSVLPIGFLSDDYVLADRAYRWQIGAFNPSAFRPFPLIVWALALHSGGGPAVLHIINIVFHGTNAYLVSHVAHSFVRDTKLSLLTGLLVLTCPVVPEAVAWCSGVFDVLATSLVLLMIITARGYETSFSTQRRVAFSLLAIAAILSKEVAAIGPVLVLIDAWAQRRLSRKLIVDASVLGGGCIVYGIIRSAGTNVRVPITKYMLQRTVFGTFGSLAAPWHFEVARELPWIPIIYTTIIVAMLMSFFAQKIKTAVIRRVAAGVAWTLVAVLPTITLLAIAPDLQGSRYLYLASIGWAVALAATASAGAESRGALRAKSGTLACLIALAAVGVQLHLRPWIRAAGQRNAVETAAAMNAAIRSCKVITVEGLPDTESGAYVFRNGVREAFSRDIGVDANVATNASGPCSFRWNGERFVATSRQIPEPAGR